MTKRLVSTLLCSAAALLIAAGPGRSQTVSWEEASVALKGVIDVHVHALPDSDPRAVDAFEIARIARRYGMRALLFKNHYTHTASLAYFVSQAVPGIEAYGGITLNNTVGGINPNAVEYMARTTGRRGRVVWMPTRDSDAVRVSRGGKLLPKVKDVLTVMARENLSLATGHVSPEESLLLIREARSMGIDRIIVTHRMSAIVGMTLEQQVEAARLGAYLEYCYNHLLPVSRGVVKPEGGLPIETLVAAIRAVGPTQAILSTDLGQQLNPIHTDGMISLILMLREQGFTEEEVDRMSKTNPARLLGLDL